MSALPAVFNTELLTGDLGCIDGAKMPEADWLQTVIYTHLFTNKRDAEQSEGGHWGDMFYDNSFGSLLWTLRREKLTQKTLSSARDICLDALNWLLKLDHVSALDVVVTRAGSRAMSIEVTATLSNNEPYNQVEEYSLDAA